jgi:hypothetical protein
LFADARRLHLHHPFGEALERAMARVAEAFAVILARGQAQGALRDDVPPATLAWLVLSLIQAREFRRMHTLEPSPLLEADLLRSVVSAVRPRQAPV